MIIIASLLALALSVICLFGATKIAKDPVLGICLFVFLSSITIMPPVPIIGDRLAVADFIMIYTLGVCAFQGKLFGRAPSGVKLVDEMATLFICISVISSFYALIFRGADVTRVLLFLFIYIYGYFCFRIIIRMVRDKGTLERVLIWWACGTLIVTFFGILASTGIYKPFWTFDPIIGRISSTFKFSGQVASYVGPSLFIFFYLATTSRLNMLTRLLFILSLFGASVVLLGAGSRIAFVIMLFAIVSGVYTILSSQSKELRRGPLMLAFLIAGFTFVGFASTLIADKSTSYGLTTTSPFERAIKIWSEQKDSGANIQTIGGTRYEEIATVLQNFENHPILGVGTGMFSSTYKINEVHNTFFGILAENGLAGFIVFLFWWTLILKFLLDSKNLCSSQGKLIIRLTLGAFFVLAIYQLTTNGLRQRPFWFVPALVISASIAVRNPYSE